MRNEKPLTEFEVKIFIYEWFSKLDVHAPAEEILTMVADDGLEMRFPEATIQSRADFGRLYNEWINSYFDEVHQLRELEIEISSDQANVTLIGYWQRRTWNRPAARSEQLAYNAVQSWTLKRSPDTSKPIIVTYIVESLDPVNVQVL